MITIHRLLPVASPSENGSQKICFIFQSKQQNDKSKNSFYSKITVHFSINDRTK